jgi:hypothetical protein
MLRLAASVSDAIAIAVRAACTDAGWSHRELARRLGTNPSAIKRLLATGSTSLDVELASSALATLGIRLTIDRGGLGLAAHSAQRDSVHAWCSAYVVRQLRRLGFEVRTEVEIGDGRTRGWIDILAYRPRDRVLLCIEVKTAIDDAGRILRHLGWNVRSARDAARRVGWSPRAIVPMLLVLFTDESEQRLSAAADLLRTSLPGNAQQALAFVNDPGAVVPGPSLALIDPRRRGRAWLLRPRIQGGRSQPRFRDYAEAAGSLTSSFRRRAWERLPR